MKIANEIASQIGNRAFAMMGAKNLVGDEKSLSWKVGRNAKSVTHVTITLDVASDTYQIEFIRCNMRAKVIRKVLASFEGVYADQLHQLIEAETGLYLSL